MCRKEFAGKMLIIVAVSNIKSLAYNEALSDRDRIRACNRPPWWMLSPALLYSHKKSLAYNEALE